MGNSLRGWPDKRQIQKILNGQPEILTSQRFRSRSIALTKAVICRIAFIRTLPAAYRAKFLTAGIGTIAPRANAMVSIKALSKIEGPILASVRAIRSSADRYNGTDTASLSSFEVKGDR